MMEDYAYILDFLARGRPDDRKFKKEPVVYAVGEQEFKLFELIPKPGVNLMIGDRVYLGKDMEKREHILHVKRRIKYDELTGTAQSELPYVVEDIVRVREKEFVEFFNTAQAITSRYHALEILSGLGKKIMQAIIAEREKRPFESFEDLEERVPSLHHPEKLIAGRIVEELSNPNTKYRLFVREKHT